jgi:hypothetical protein
MTDRHPRRLNPARRSAGLAVGLMASLTRTAAGSPALIEFQGTHADTSYVVQHIEWIETRPFDGIVINDFLGRNLFNTRLRADAPQVLDAGTGAVTYDAAARSLAPLKGIFRRFHHNFAKVNFSLVGPPPLLTDDAGWQVEYESATNYARAVQAAGLEGVFFDNEIYVHPSLAGHPVDYWRFEDQVALAGTAPSAMPFPKAVELTARRGRELMQAFERGYPDIVVIVAHGPAEGCDGWRAVLGHYGADRNLSGAFGAGMIAGTSARATFVDGGEDFDLRSASDFAAARAWRKGLSGGITNLGPTHCPFMNASLAGGWPHRVSIAFSTFDKDRASLRTDHWTPITDVETFRTTLTNALHACDRYVWHYSEWQDWWGNTTEDSLQSWISAIKAARQDPGIEPPP